MIGDDVAVRAKQANFNGLKAAGKPLKVMPYSRFIRTGRAVSQLRYGFRYRYYSFDSNPSNGAQYQDGIEHRAITAMTKAQFDLLFAAKRNIALQTAKAKFQNNIENVIVEAPLELAEMHKTAKLVHGRVNDLANFAFKFVKANASLRRSAIKLLKRSIAAGNRSRSFIDMAANLNQMYLEYNYGWKPLMSLFDDASKLLVEHMDSHVARTKISGHEWFVEKSDSFVEKLTTWHGTDTDNGYYYDVFEHLEYRHDVWIGGLLAGISRRDDLVQQLGFNANNVIPTLWELAYMSFIADYFANIGNWLGNLRNSVSQMNTDTLYLTTKSLATQTVELKNWSPYNSNPLRAPYYTYDRAKFKSLPVSSLKCMSFDRVPIAAADTRVELTLLSPSWRQLFNTISVAGSVALKGRQVIYNRY